MTPEINDEELIKLAKDGDLNAFETFIKRYQQPLFNFIYKMCRNYELSEDILQESFVKFYYSINKIKHYCSIRSFLYTLTRNIFIDKTRKRQIKPVYLEEVGPDTNMKFKNNTEYDITKLLTSLSPEEKSLAILFFEHNFTHKELSEFLGIPIGTVKSRLYNMVNKLRRSLYGK